MTKRPFVLSGGGARGFAHLGVVKALNEHGIYPSEIAGTSAGALAGAFLANGFTPDEVKEIFLTKLKLRLLSWNSFKMGIISNKRIREFLIANLRYTKFEDLVFPLYITATNFIDGSQRIFQHGDLIEPVLAASTIPSIFPPVFIDDIPFVDGGLANNLPIEPLIDKRGEAICVYVNPIKEFNPKIGIMEAMDRSWHLSFRKTVNTSANGCYMYIEPQPLDQFGMFDLHKMTTIVDIGYSYADKFLKENYGMENGNLK
jgi:NTE family protein